MKEESYVYYPSGPFYAELYLYTYCTPQVKSCMHGVMCWLTDGSALPTVEWVLRGPTRGKRVAVWCTLLVCNRVTLEQIMAVLLVSMYFSTRLQKLRKTIIASSFLSVRPSARNNWAPTGRKFGIWVFFNNLLRKFKFHCNLTTITCTLHEDRYTFLITSRWILLRMINVSDRSCSENQNTHFVFSKPLFLF